MKSLAILFVAFLLGCPPAPQAPSPRMGNAMIEIGMRFQRAGKAASVSRWELATYDVAEMQEVFKDDVPHTHWMENSELRRLSREFEHDALPALLSVVKGRDIAATQRTFAAAANSCNACHKAAGMSYIEVQAALGAPEPAVDPPPTATSGSR